MSNIQTGTAEVIKSLTSDISDWSMGLIIHANRLQKLALRLDHENAGEELLDRLSSMEEGAFPKLQEFRLSCACFTEETIVRLLLQLRESLRSMSFRCTTVRPGGAWVTVFRALRYECPLLESIHLYRLVEWPREDHYAVVLTPAVSESTVVLGSHGRRFTLIYQKTGKRLIGVRLFGATDGCGFGAPGEVIIASSTGCNGGQSGLNIGYGTYDHIDSVL
ncbi:hypothetical protein M432DRAFT_240083 [Thermoascus aurantiacus ATCC 26904]